MTQLFKQKQDEPIKLVELMKQQDISGVRKGESPLETTDISTNGNTNNLQTFPSIESETEPIDLASALGNLTGGSETTATDVIRELGTADENLPMKTILPNPAAFTAVKILEDYNTYLGMDNVTEFLHNFVDWHYKHLCAHKGKRAEQQFQALTQVKQEEFQLEKEAKGLLHR